MSGLTLFTIAATQSFLDHFVTGLQRFSPEEIAAHTILLPTRRACRTLSEAFLRASSGAPLLLPRLVPITDLEDDDLLFLDEPDLPPPVPELHRHLALIELVLAWGRREGVGPFTPGQAAPLARSLAAFLDEAQSEGCALDELHKLVPEDYARHWQESLKFLKILTEQWPAHLAGIEGMDRVERRNQLLRSRAAAWRKKPPPDPVIAAGITGGVPAVVELLSVVAGLPRGAVILPGLDLEADAASWEVIEQDPTHPQHEMALLLTALGAERAEVRPWIDRVTNPARLTLIAETMRPAADSDRWGGVTLGPASLAGLSRVDCANPREEATVIALMLREKLDLASATAALVTPDRALARRVASELRRWDIAIDDSAGVPLSRTEPGVFLRLVLTVAEENLAPVPLLAALKHPLAAGGREPAAFRALARQLEIAVLRGPRPEPGIAGLEKISDAPIVGVLAQAFAALLAAIGAEEIQLTALIKAHIEAVEALAKSPETPGAARIWREEAGEAAAKFLNEFLQAAENFPPLVGRDYPALFEAMLAGPVVRPRWGLHPRLFIWGLLEARLQHADLIVLGGLNEGQWPPQVESDPWLSRPMRRDFALPAPERRVGQAAHDFAQLLGAPQVVLTRAERVEGTPTVPSRWLLRLETVLRAAKLEVRPALYRSDMFHAWQGLLDEPATAPRPCAAPAPRPPVSARPRRLSVGQIETLMRDPYAIFAGVILGLMPLDPIDQEPGVAERGTIIHQALDRFVRAFPEALPRHALSRLREIGREAFGDTLVRPQVASFWWPRFERIAEWFIEIETLRRPDLRGLYTEMKGEMIIAAPGGPFRLTARADRIDRLAEGGLVLIDYKTGGVPKRTDVAQGLSPQLTLEAVIAEAGGFPLIGAARVHELAYWHLGGGSPAGEELKLGVRGLSVEAMIAEAGRKLVELIAHFDDPDTPYLAIPRPENAPRYSRYEHLARIKEWMPAWERQP